MMVIARVVKTPIIAIKSVPSGEQEERVRKRIVGVFCGRKKTENHQK
jgi:hypothetical protein